MEKGISYCTVCHKRLWQLQQTLPHNLQFTEVGLIEICVLVFNDEETYSWLDQNFKEYLDDGRLVIKHHQEDHVFEFGYVKQLSHALGSKRVLFNLDADNYIDGSVEHLMDLKDGEIVITDQRYPDLKDGRIGRIGLTRRIYDRIGGYDYGVGSKQDGLLVYKAASIGCRIIQIPCPQKPVSNLK